MYLLALSTTCPSSVVPRWHPPYGATLRATVTCAPARTGRRASRSRTSCTGRRRHWNSKHKFRRPPLVNIFSERMERHATAAGDMNDQTLNQMMILRQPRSKGEIGDVGRMQEVARSNETEMHTLRKPNMHDNGVIVRRREEKQTSKGAVQLKRISIERRITTIFAVLSVYILFRNPTFWRLQHSANTTVWRKTCTGGEMCSGPQGGCIPQRHTRGEPPVLPFNKVPQAPCLGGNHAASNWRAVGFSSLQVV